MLEQNKKSRVKIFLASAVEFLSTETLTNCQSNETDTFSQPLILRNDYKHHHQTRRKLIIKVLTKEMSTQIDRKLSLRTSTCGFAEVKRCKIHYFSPICPYFSLQENKYITLKTELIPKMSKSV